MLAQQDTIAPQEQLMQSHVPQELTRPSQEDPQFWNALRLPQVTGQLLLLPHIVEILAVLVIIV